MEKLKTRNEYVGCNKKCRFYADEIRATSYGWWDFVKVINGKVIFNNYKYSSTTSRHQSEVKWLMRNLGIKIDAYVYMSESLTENSFKTDALDTFYELAIQHIVTNHTKRVRKKTIERNKVAIQTLKERIKNLRNIGAEHSFKDIIKIYRYYKRKRDNKETFLKESKKVLNKIYMDKNKTQWIVRKKDNKDEMLLLEKINSETRWNSKKKVYFKYFNQDYKYCSLANALILK